MRVTLLIAVAHDQFLIQLQPEVQSRDQTDAEETATEELPKVSVLTYRLHYWHLLGNEKYMDTLRPRISGKYGGSSISWA
jgi:hypothetical protein